MAAGQPYLTTDPDEWLFAVLSVDPFMVEYASGGFWANDPDQISNGAWDASTVYGFRDIANGTDNQPYWSLINDNENNDPSTSPDAWALCFPCVRWWVQSQNADVKRQDGRAGRVESQPMYVVCMLDRQYGGTIDKIGGTNGHLKDGSLRLVNLLDARNEFFTLSDGRTNQFTAFQKSAHEQSDPVAGGYDVMVGHWYQFRVQ